MESDESDWTDLPPAEAVVDLPPVAVDKPDTVPTVAPGSCLTCGDPIVREPGARGRLPKYHPDCRPLRTAAANAASIRGRGKNSRAEAEAEAIVAALQKQIIKGVVMLSVVDRFSAFCVMANLPSFCDNLKGILARSDKWRREFLAMESGGSIIGLILSIIMIALPIAAHHGLLGKSNAAKLLIELPFTLLKIQQRLKEGTEALTAMMAEQLKRAAEENKKQAEKPASAAATDETGAA